MDTLGVYGTRIIFVMHTVYRRLICYVDNTQNRNLSFKWTSKMENLNFKKYFTVIYMMGNVNSQIFWSLYILGSNFHLKSYLGLKTRFYIGNAV